MVLYVVHNVAVATDTVLVDDDARFVLSVWVPFVLSHWQGQARRRGRGRRGRRGCRRRRRRRCSQQQRRQEEQPSQARPTHEDMIFHTGSSDDVLGWFGQPIHVFSG